MEDIRKRVLKVFKEVFDNKNLQIYDDQLSDTVKGWDSLLHINLMVSIEEEFDIKFAMDEVNKLNSLGKIIEHIEKKL